tara:strand:- start:5310 stop:6965 length:1656 start_codon:yes stop_codon:yes gene_type:complete
MRVNIYYIIIFVLVITLLLLLINYNNKEPFNTIKIGLLTRCKNEKYISSFVDYYLDQGIDNIYIIDDNSYDISIYNNIINYSNVKIYYEKNIISRNTAQKVYNEIKNDLDWLIYVDVDEYITTKKNKYDTIRNTLLTTFKNADCIQIPWVMMSFNSILNDPDNLLETNTYRWNHDLKHQNHITKDTKFRCRYDKIEIKCIFKTSKFDIIKDHSPISTFNKNLNVVDGVMNYSTQLGAFHKNLRENDINNGFLLCYHYRLVSLYHCIRKINENSWYKENKYSVKDLISNDYPEINDNTLKKKSQIRNLNLNDLYLIHVGKCGGSSLEEMFKLKQYHLNKPIYKSSSKYIICIRNPIKRFVSAFNMLKDLINFDIKGYDYNRLYLSKDTPFYKLKNKINGKLNDNNPFKSSLFYHNLAFFESANHLAESITSQSHEVKTKAIQIMNHDEEHIYKGIGWYLDDGDFVKKYHDKILFVIRQEHFNEDANNLSKILKMNFKYENLRTSKKKNIYMSNLAIGNIINFYKETDYKTLAVLKQYNLINEDTLQSYYKYT